MPGHGDILWVSQQRELGFQGQHAVRHWAAKLMNRCDISHKLHYTWHLTPDKALCVGDAFSCDYQYLEDRMELLV